MARDVGERHQYRNFTDLVDDLTSARDTALADLDAATKHCDQAISELMTATDERDKAQAELAVTTDERDKAQAELALRDARIAALESAAGAILGLAQGVLHGN
jgi:chromosome segregation ATPase